MAVIHFAWTFDDQSFRHALMDAATQTNDAAVALRELAINATRDPDPAAARYLSPVVSTRPSPMTTHGYRSGRIRPTCGRPTCGSSWR